MQRNSRIAAAIAMGAVCIGAQAAEQAANYPSRPIRFIVGFPPGGTNDIIARLLAHKLSENIGQTVIVDNRAGANTAIASEYFVRSAPPEVPAPRPPAREPSTASPDPSAVIDWLVEKSPGRRAP